MTDTLPRDFGSALPPRDPMNALPHWMPPGVTFEAQLARYTRMATTPGWWANAQAAVRRLDADPSGLYRGLYRQVAARVLALGYRPASAELGRWWECPSQAERELAHRPADVSARRGWLH